ncbi:MAG: alpha-mannosidase [Planctomycetes bacterium]|nr:alpha-mannosidase [Planctomycetota bacterium]
MERRTSVPNKRVHLICNAHLDPVWLWEWEEGAAEAISTFRTAADLCEEFPGFVFNHNEVTLYKWVEEYEPGLFARIRRLVRRGQWRIMGGWYLQPDCNMPCGESFIRQILLGRHYFKERFGVDVRTAINLDPFGHSRGLPQILAKAGYDSYLFCRPDQNDCPLPDEDFIWVGVDGSEMVGSRVLGWYNSQLGKIGRKINDWLASFGNRSPGVLLWGVGNHGGGPSREDLRQIARMTPEKRKAGWDLIHSTPDAFFADLAHSGRRLPRFRKDLNPWGVGCYTSMIRIKQKHRQLENELYTLEKMAVTAAVQGLMEYPQAQIDEALHDLMVGEFHDILPGSSIQPVEESSLRMFDHGLEIASRLKARAFFALAHGQPRARPGEIPILVYNPHPYPVRMQIECEFNLPDANWEEQFTVATAYRNGKPLPSQIEQQLSNLNLDWRKRIVFDAELAPARMNRFDCRLAVLKRKPAPKPRPRGGRIRFRNREIEVIINTRTGLIDRYRVGGVDYLGKDAFQPLVIKDNEDPWGMTVRSFRKVIGRFRLLPRGKGTRFSGATEGPIPSVRVIEDGDVRSVVEAVLGYGDSFICMRYLLPKCGTEVGIEVRVHWNEKDRMLKLSVPTTGRDEKYVGQIAGGIGDLPDNGDEAVAQRWVAAVSRRENKALTLINNGIYGSDYADNEVRLSLLRSPAYSAHPIFDRTIVTQDRYLPRQEQGERQYRFWLNAGPVAGRLESVDREALARNEKPFALSFFPSGNGRKPKPGVTLSDRAVQVMAVKPALRGRPVHRGGNLIVRLFEPTGRHRDTYMTLPFLGLRTQVRLGRFEIKTLRISLKTKRVVETDLLERPLRG